MAKQKAKVTDPRVRKAGQKAEVKGIVPQKHGGAIWQGPPANPVAGTGRPPDEIRAMMRRNLSEVLPDILERYKAGTLDHVRVAEFLARYGLGTKDEVALKDDPRVKALIGRVSEIVFELAGAEIHGQVAARLESEGF